MVSFPSPSVNLEGASVGSFGSGSLWKRQSSCQSGLQSMEGLTGAGETTLKLTHLLLVPHHRTLSIGRLTAWWLAPFRMREEREPQTQGADAYNPIWKNDTISIS